MQIVYLLTLSTACDCTRRKKTHENTGTQGLTSSIIYFFIDLFIACT